MTLPDIRSGNEPVMPSANEKTGTKANLFDNFGRRINYVRLAVTDRCNLRCIYCMPEKMRFLPRKEILSFEEMERLIRILAEMGITKVRITGGEPFVRKGITTFLQKLHDIPGIEKIHITTNGVLTTPYLPLLKELGIASINLSLDTLDPKRFYEMTRRDDFTAVMRCFDEVLKHDIPLKINVVLMEGKNTEDIIPMTALTKNYPVDVRFIEEMPFNGTNNGKSALRWDYRRIIEHLKKNYPTIEKVIDPPTSTSMNFQIPGHAGRVGIIAGFSRTFCGTCNRIRLTARGTLQTCLYGKNVFDAKAKLRDGATDDELKMMFKHHIGHRFKDGIAAEKDRLAENGMTESMSLIGG